MQQTFLPTVLLTILNPTLTTLLTHLAEKLTEMENYETHDGEQSRVENPCGSSG